MDVNAVRHSESLLIAWRLAELEAAHLKQSELEPVHFFLGLLKLVEMDVSAILLEKTTLSTDRIQEGSSHVETLRHAFTTAGVDTTRTRRRLRKLLPPGDAAGEDIKNIRRSPATRTIFTKAEQMLADAPLAVLQPLHLLEAILAVECPFILQSLDMVGGDIAKLKETVSHALGLTEPTVEPRTERTQDKKGAIVAQNKKVPKGLADRLGRDLTELAKNGSLSPVIGRKNEMRSLVQTMLRSRKNNAILIGEAGVGKTGIVEGLAQKIAEGAVPPEFVDKRIVEISMGSLVAGTNLRGDFEEKLQALITQAKRDDQLILFIDEIHLIVGAGTGSGTAMDAANLLKPALARGEICVIGATTTQEYRKFIESDLALARRFEVIEVLEPSREETLAILAGLRAIMEDHHGVKIAEAALESAVDLTIRYLPDRRLPDKAIDVLDQACVQARMRSLTGDFRSQVRQALIIQKKQVADAVAHRCKVAVGEIMEDEAARLLRLEEELGKRIKGQPQALASVCKAVRLAKSGLGAIDQPLAVFLFAGPSGTGKTELAKALADLLFGGVERGLVRIDMSELMDEHSVSKLIGSPPGFVGHSQGGQLTEEIRSKPSSVVLLDEIEKAHPKILDIFLQIFDEGFVTDARGNRCDFRNSIIVMTTNAGMAQSQRGMGFLPEHGECASLNERVTSGLERVFRPEFLNRIGSIAVFNSLDQAAFTEIVSINIQRLRSRLEKKDVALELTERALDWLVARGLSDRYGARFVERLVADEVATPLASMILMSGENGTSGRIVVDLIGERLNFGFEPMSD